MNKAVVLLLILATTDASPAIPPDSSSQPVSLLEVPSPGLFRRRNGLPPVSEVMLALEMQSLLPKVFTTPTETLRTLSAVSTRSLNAIIPLTTLPYTGPGILILPGSSPSSGQATPTNTSNTTTSSTQGNFSKNSSHKYSLPRHLAIVGGAFAVMLFLVTCGFFLLDPRMWRACSRFRKGKKRLDRENRCKKQPLPDWMRITPSFSSADKSFEKKRLPTLSPYPYGLPDGLKSKFSMTTASEYSCSGDYSFDTTTSSPQVPSLPYNDPGRPLALSPSLPSYSPGPGRNTRLLTPVRPPRPPTVDSPAAIESIYYADVDDQGFYRHPNPIVLEPASPIINNPPPMPTTGAQSHLNFLPPTHQFFSSNVLGMDALQRHIRSRSAPAVDVLSTTKNRLSGATTITQDTVDSAGSDSDYSQQKSQRKSTSAVSWVRYSEFQQQHHLRLQQGKPEDKFSSRPCTSPPRERNGIGSAY